MTTKLIELIESFPGRRVLVVGDAILDHYVIGSVSRTSPEAPVAVLRVTEDEWLPGGAANVARNLAAQRCQATLISLRGDDEHGRRLEELLGRDASIRLAFVVDKTRPTTLKTRCVAQGQQMMRLDREESGPISDTVRKRVMTAVRREMKQADGVILSDYGKGLLTTALVQEIIAAAREYNVEVLVDPKGTDYSRYKGATLITPNQKEAQEASGISIVDEESAREAARILQAKVRGKAICITLGGRGVAVFPRRGRSVQIPARAREVFDVTGAGDTFIALFSLARFCGATFPQAAEIGNVAAGIVVGRAGVATVSLDELKREFLGQSANRKAMGMRELAEVCHSLSRAGRKTVFTNGCFDVLNVRHIRLLEQARALGDVLVVALNSDASVRRLKGEPRPLLTESERVELIGSLPYVDYITVFDGETPNELLERLRPDILVKGTNVENVVGQEIVEGYGGEIRLLDLGFGPSVDEVIHRAAEGTAPNKRKRKGRT
ncbi:D-glycero-beta-D-manno-heptose-7-phosphate kinase [bacterium]|nr:D-glycero-beta-D-manno-heptose-7-phosphate kinase [bacterium]